MASCIDVASEQLCYIPCNFCNIVLAVSVPCSSLFDIVTVRCGHCTNLWSVNMAAAFQSSSTSSWQNHQAQVPNHTAPEYRMDFGSSTKCTMNRMTMRTPITSNIHHEERIVNRPPEKRQRVPSAYNQFIKEEIQRIKANNPDISHREAFSTAAKNMGNDRSITLFWCSGHTSLTFTLDSCWRATIKPNLLVGAENYKLLC